jgi:hypothetical protein
VDAIAMPVFPAVIAPTQRSDTENQQMVASAHSYPPARMTFLK